MNISTLYQVFKKHPNISTDSRNCPENSIFFALKGDSFNGNQFACSALEQGAAFAVIDEKRYQKADDPRYILVNNVLETLQQLANYHRRQLGTRIIAITGTNGKTTTKELVAAVLGKTHNVLYTEGNLNNHIGVPKTLLRLTAEHDIAVIEMGANHPGEIKQLAEIAEPNFGLITNVGIAHIEGFGSFEGVVQTKGELYDYLRTQKKAVVFIQNNNEHLRAISDGSSSHGMPSAGKTTCSQQERSSTVRHFSTSNGDTQTGNGRKYTQNLSEHTTLTTFWRQLPSAVTLKCL